MPFNPLSAYTRRRDHRLLHPLSHQYVVLQLRGLGLQALESRLGIHSLILRPLPILNVLSVSHRKPLSRGLWSPRYPLRTIQIVEPDHSIPSYILTLRPCDSSRSLGIHLDYSRGILEVRHVAEALHIPYELVDPADFWEWSPISQRDMVHILSRRTLILSQLVSQLIHVLSMVPDSGAI
ncbi:hypothetical protein CK203_101321 [Vitis vinifera]|uniref:Uncharacterized protein n=1 Tax=Vitis vinifera TaxID=29760 RepID=A0A438C5P0_VITVI|nr:hypothetical protein CK203_101321 [Vitis vinifera]